MKFPQRNLPGESVPWAREVESVLQQGEKNRSSISESLNNSQRSFSSQLSVIARQIDELSDRSITSLPVSVSNATQASPGTGSVFIPSATERAAIIVFNSEYENVGVGSGNVFLSLSQDGVVRARTFGFMTPNPPAGWPGGSVSAGFAVTVPEGGTTLSVRLDVVQFQSGVIIESVQPSFGVYFGNLV